MVTLKEYRKINGLTLDQLATQLGVSAQALHQWEKGDRQPGSRVMQKISNALGMIVCVRPQDSGIYLSI